MSFDKNLSVWLPMYFDMLHIIVRTYKNDKTRNSKAIQCFIQSLSDIIPSQQVRKNVQEFIIMSPRVMDTITNNKIIQGFFNINKHIKDTLDESNSSFFLYVIKDSELLFMWTYLLRAYIDLTLYNKITISFSSLLDVYDLKRINKQIWGNALWFVIHHSAYNAPEYDKIWTTSYKSFITCLMYVMPCAYCREHLGENLAQISIDQYLFDNKAFEYSWTLHNTVNKFLKKPEISLSEARNIYSRDFST